MKDFFEYYNWKNLYREKAKIQKTDALWWLWKKILEKTNKEEKNAKNKSEEEILNNIWSYEQLYKDENWILIKKEEVWNFIDKMNIKWKKLINWIENGGIWTFYMLLWLLWKTISEYNKKAKEKWEETAKKAINVKEEINKNFLDYANAYYNWKNLIKNSNNKVINTTKTWAKKFIKLFN